MPDQDDHPDAFDRLVKELDALGDQDLLAAWRENSSHLRQAEADRSSLWVRDGLRQRHYAFRLLAIRRFGAVGHLDRYQGALAA